MSSSESASAILCNQGNEDLTTVKSKSGSDTLPKRSVTVEDEMEIVPASASDSSDSSSIEDGWEDDDTDIKTEIRALAKEMLESTRKQREIEDMAYHKRVLDEDLYRLPEWFIPDQGKIRLQIEDMASDSSNSSSIEDGWEDNDTDIKAELRALAKEMLESTRKQREIEDMAYHKRVLDEDLYRLPEWFVRDQMENTTIKMGQVLMS